MAEDRLSQLLAQHQMSDAMIDRINNAGFSPEDRDVLYEQFKDASKTQLLVGITQSINNKDKSNISSNTNPTTQTNSESPILQELTPILGRALTQESLKYIKDIYPDIEHPATQQQYIQLLKKVPEEERFHIVAATLKIAEISKHDNNVSEPYGNRDSYKDFNIVVSHTLPAIYSWGQTTQKAITDIAKMDDFEVLKEYPKNPLSYARILIYNEHPQRIESDSIAAKEAVAGITHSVGGESSLVKLQQFIDESKNISEKIYNTVGYRRLSSEQRKELFKDILINKELKEDSIIRITQAYTGGRNG